MEDDGYEGRPEAVIGYIAASFVIVVIVIAILIWKSL